jgi:GT2 family glycosyltransferase
LSGPYHRGEGKKDTGQYDHVRLVDYVTGAALMIKAEVIRKIGLLDEGFSPLYYEDTDLCVRASLSGYTIAYTPKPTLTHHCGASSDKLGSESKKFYAKRSLIRFVLLNYQAKDILKRTLLYETKEFIRCLVVKSQDGPFPIVLRTDAATKLTLFCRPWLANIRNRKEIIYLRRQRFVNGGKLHV